MRSARFAVLPLVALALLPQAAGAQDYPNTYLLPVVAHTAGTGNPPTYWVSDVTLYNPNDSASGGTIKLDFAAAGESVKPLSIDIIDRTWQHHEQAYAGDFLLFDSWHRFCIKSTIFCKRLSIIKYNANIIIFTKRTYK